MNAITAPVAAPTEPAIPCIVTPAIINLAGAWVPMREPPPVFGSIQITDTGSDFGPLFAGQQQEAQP